MSDNNKEPKRYRQLASQFLKEHEGYSPEIYTDSTGNPTTGYGFNLNSPSTQAAMEKNSIDPNKPMSREDADKIMDTILSDEKEKYYENIKKASFPEFKEDDTKKAALLSTMYMAPGMVDDRLRESLNKNDDEAVVRQLATYSNQTGQPGISKRLFETAKLYSPETFENVMNNLDSNTIRKLQEEFNKIQNINEKQRVLQEYPFLDKIVMPRFGKIPKD